MSAKYEKFHLKINPLHIHHILSGALLLVSDSQSMSVEAAILGVPSIRFSSFTGRISVLEELEYKYNLTFGISPSNSMGLIEKVLDILNTENLKQIFSNRRDTMLREKINVAKFISWFILEYPRSISTSYKVK